MSVPYRLPSLVEAAQFRRSEEMMALKPRQIVQKGVHQKKKVGRYAPKCPEPSPS